MIILKLPRFLIKRDDDAKKKKMTKSLKNHWIDLNVKSLTKTTNHRIDVNVVFPILELDLTQQPDHPSGQPDGWIRPIPV